MGERPTHPRATLPPPTNCSGGHTHGANGPSRGQVRRVATPFPPPHPRRPLPLPLRPPSPAGTSPEPSWLMRAGAESVERHWIEKETRACPWAYRLLFLSSRGSDRTAVTGHQPPWLAATPCSDCGAPPTRRRATAPGPPGPPPPPPPKRGHPTSHPHPHTAHPVPPTAAVTPPARPAGPTLSWPRPARLRST